MSDGTSDMQHAGRVLLHADQGHASFVVSMAARVSFWRFVRRSMACCGRGTSRVFMCDSCREVKAVRCAMAASRCPRLALAAARLPWSAKSFKLAGAVRTKSSRT